MVKNHCAFPSPYSPSGLQNQGSNRSLNLIVIPPHQICRNVHKSTQTNISILSYIII
jgi:hypothetical protein